MERSSLGAHSCGVLLVTMAAVCSAGNAVLNRSLRELDFLVLMTYHGLVGFMISLIILAANSLLLNADTAVLRTPELQPSEVIVLTLGASIDALSVFC